MHPLIFLHVYAKLWVVFDWLYLFHHRPHGAHQVELTTLHPCSSSPPHSPSPYPPGPSVASPASSCATKWSWCWWQTWQLPYCPDKFRYPPRVIQCCFTWCETLVATSLVASLAIAAALPIGRPESFNRAACVVTIDISWALIFRLNFHHLPGWIWKQVGKQPSR